MSNALNLIANKNAGSTINTNFDCYSINTTFSSIETGSDDVKYYKLLLVGCNTEMVQFISACLPTFRVQSITDNIEKLLQAIAQNPDIVLINSHTLISAGYDILGKVNTYIQERLTTIILMFEEPIVATYPDELLNGVDDYLFKPFSKGELQLRINKLANKHLQLHADINNKTWAPTTDTKVNFNSSLFLEDSFLKKTFYILEQHLSVSDFGVEDVANSLFMSRAKLHRKIIKLIGLAPGTLIKNYRLMRAAQFLKEGCNSSETAFKTGFSSPAYFTSCFHKFYKITPLEFCRNIL